MANFSQRQLGLLKRHLPNFVFCTGESKRSKLLVDTLISLFTSGDLNKTLKFAGDRFTYDLLESQFINWGIDISYHPSSNDMLDDTMYLPRPLERVEDVPEVISYMVDDIFKRIGHNTLSHK